jgi:FkbM family methyltransferase
MPLTSLARRKLLFSERLPLLAGGPVTFIDVGARGDLDEPWSLMPPASLSVIGFEPDAVECEKLNADLNPHIMRRYFPAALWSEQKNITFYINTVPATSSVFPANMGLIQQFAEEHWRPREVVKTVDVSATTLDLVVKEQGIDPDFLKLDTQGAELPILKGATKTLQKNVVAILAETWCAEIYKGQGLSGEVLSLMNGCGFTLFDVNVAAAWQRAVNGVNTIRGKPQIIGLDFLFVRDNAIELIEEGGLGKVIKAAAIADCFGFPGAALDMLGSAFLRHPHNAAVAEAFDHILAIARQREGLLQRIRRRLARWVGRPEHSYPNLHY